MPRGTRARVPLQLTDRGLERVDSPRPASGWFQKGPEQVERDSDDLAGTARQGNAPIGLVLVYTENMLET